MGQHHFRACPIPAANVSSVPNYSPLRYPGGKTWLIPHLRSWMAALPHQPVRFHEPFAGGATASLLAVMEGYAAEINLNDNDVEVMDFWQAVVVAGASLAEAVRAIRGPEDVAGIPDNWLGRALRFLVRNRTSFGGITAGGAGSIAKGDGRGSFSRWYPDTLADRILAIHEHRKAVKLWDSDGIEFIRKHPCGSVWFIDPPYRAGRRLYRDPGPPVRLVFEAAATLNEWCCFLMTMEDTTEVRRLVREHGFHAAVVAVKGNSHRVGKELLITREKMAWTEAPGTGGVQDR